MCLQNGPLLVSRSGITCNAIYTFKHLRKTPTAGPEPATLTPEDRANAKLTKWRAGGRVAGFTNVTPIVKFQYYQNHKLGNRQNRKIDHRYRQCEIVKIENR